MSSPPSAGPTVFTDHIDPSSRAMALGRSFGVTNALRWAPLAAANTIVADTSTAATTQSWAKLSTPAAQPAGTLANATNRVRSAPTITGRLWWYSTHGPNGIVITAAASPAAAASIAT
ncbi:hypothetical protein GCM10009593_26430 [Microlunatus antarcticus]